MFKLLLGFAIWLAKCIFRVCVMVICMLAIRYNWKKCKAAEKMCEEYGGKAYENAATDSFLYAAIALSLLIHVISTLF